MTRNALVAGQITDSRVRQRLTEARGDLFVAASLLGCTARELDGYIRADAGLQALVAGIEKVKVDEGYARLSKEQFQNRLAELTEHYQLDGLEEIHKIATIPLENLTADAMGVKLKAAVALRGAGPVMGGNSDLDALLAQLDSEYRSNAPRIAEVRMVQVTMRDPWDDLLN